MQYNSKDKIVELIQSAEEEKPTSNITIKGDSNIIGHGNVITQKVTSKVVAKPKPGVEHISESQVRRLHDLKDEIIRLEKIAKRKPATYQRVWTSLNKKCGVATMRMIPIEKFDLAEKYFLSWIARLTDTATVKKKDIDGVRLKRLKYIHVNMRRLNIEDKVRAYMRKKFKTDSLKELTQEEMEMVYRYVATQKRNS